MAKFTLEENSGGDFLNLPDDAIVQVEVVSVETRAATNSKTGESWNKENFRFKITDIPDALQEEFGVLEGSTIFGSVSSKFTMHPDNKLRQWVEALLDMELDAGFELDTDMLVGRRARAVISSYIKKDGTRNHQVAGLLPLVSAAIGSGGTTPAAGIWDDDEPPF